MDTELDRRGVDHERTERALALLRGRLRDHPDVIGTGLASYCGVRVLNVLARRYLPELPEEVLTIPVIQDVREMPRPWRSVVDDGVGNSVGIGASPVQTTQSL